MNILSIFQKCTLLVTKLTPERHLKFPVFICPPEYAKIALFLTFLSKRGFCHDEWNARGKVLETHQISTIILVCDLKCVGKHAFEEIQFQNSKS